MAGTSAASFGPCITEADGIETCADACANAGGSCVESGCAAGSSAYTYLFWDGADVARCQALETNGIAGYVDCQGLLLWDLYAAVRCCCTDTN